MVGVIALASVSANAEFIDTDWLVDNDSKSTLDSLTGIEWLKTNETQGMSYSNVVNQLGTTYVGWRLPTKAEIDTLATHLF